MIGLILGAALSVLPLCAAEIHYRGDLGNVLGELVMIHGDRALSELKAFSLVNSYLNSVASNSLEEVRISVRNFIHDNYFLDHCIITYSPDRLSAAIIEETARKNHNLQLLDCFDYVYASNQGGKIEAYTTTYERCKRKIKYAPFFTKNYVCIDFGSEGKNPPQEDVLTGISWRRVTREVSKLHVFNNTKGRNVPTGWFARLLPGLYDKAMSQKKNTGMVHNFNINSLQPGTLLRQDLDILNKFMTYGIHADWDKLKNKKYSYLLLNILACYGSPDALLNYLDRHLGVQKVMLPDYGTFFMSRSRDIILFRETENDLGSVLTDRYDSCLSIFAQTTLAYIADLKKASVFLGKYWSFELRKRIKLWSQAAKFLQSKRLVFIPQDNYLMRYDFLSNMVTVFSVLKDEKWLAYAQIPTVTVPSDIRISSLRFVEGKITYIREGVKDLTK